MNALTCALDKEKITVGEHLSLNCAGELNSDFSIERSEFKLEEANKYTVKLFKLKRTDNSGVHLDFTFYSPGDYKINELILTDGVNDISLSGPSVKVESVIKPPTDGKPVQPFGPLLPISIATPVYYYLLLAGVLLTALGLIIFRLKRLSYYKKLKQKLKIYDSPIEPDTQFYKTIRLAEKAEFPLEQVEKAFRLYNLRAYRLPMFDLSNERILKYFKRNFPQYKTTRTQLIRLLNELDDLQKNNNLLSVTDRHEFVKKLYRYVDNNKGLNS